MAATSKAVQALLDLEDAAPSELMEVAPGMDTPLWSHVRMEFAATLAADETGSVAVPAAASPWAVRRRLVKAMLPSRWDARNLRAKADICFFVGGGTLTAGGRSASNWLIEDFTRSNPDASAVLQWRPLPSPLGHPAFRRTRSIDPILARADFAAHRRPVPTSTAVGIAALVQRFATLIPAHIEQSEIDRITATSVSQERLRPFMVREVDRVLQRLQPRVALLEDASYGYRSPYVALLRRNGVHVAEPQHGWIGASHAAYNYGAAYQQPELRNTLPDDLLTFGEAWSHSVRHPSRRIAIGKPHLTRRVAAASVRTRKEVLIVSSVAAPDETDRFVSDLRSFLADDWFVRFRPHPGERTAVANRYPMIAKNPHIEIDTTPDVYDGLERSTVVIGVASTVLFEAVAFGCVVYARDTPFAETIVGEAFGRRVTSASEVADRLQRLTVATKTTTNPDLWAPDPQQRFSDWLGTILG